MEQAADAIVIGAGPNGLVAANLLADAGWDVVVLEGAAQPGGAVRTAELTEPGFRHDMFSAFYPLGAASPVMRELDLEAHGVRWRHADVVLAHPAGDGSCAILSRDVDETAASLEAFAPGDGEAWRRLYARWERVGPILIDALFTSFPPVGPGLRLAGALRGRGLARFARFGVLPVRRLGEEAFAGAGGRRLLAGNALHADLSPESAGGGLFGWLLCALGQQVGYPVPEGGAGRLADALVNRLRRVGGVVHCGRSVEHIGVDGGRATGVRTADGDWWTARRAVLADVGAVDLYQRLLPPDAVPGALRADLARFELDSATVKVDWALDGRIPWANPDARRAGTLHVAESVDELSQYMGRLARGEIPERPFLVMGQYASYDQTRAPAGRETAWAYTHVPQRTRGDGGGDGLTGTWDAAETAAFAARVEAEVEALAPGFGALIRGRHVLTPPAMQRENPNLMGGALNGGTAQLHQQLVFRPVPGLGRPQTPVRGLYLASASAHPGGGVHGACGANAAQAALGPARRLRRLLRRA